MGIASGCVDVRWAFMYSGMLGRIDW